MVYPCELALGKGKKGSVCSSVAAQCPIPTHMAMHGDMGRNGYGWGGGDSGRENFDNTKANGAA